MASYLSFLCYCCLGMEPELVAELGGVPGRHPEWLVGFDGFL